MWILGLKGLRKLRIITQGHGIHHDRKAAKFKQGRIESKRKTQKTGSRNFLINFLVFLLACSALSGLVRMSQKAGSKQNKICQTWEKGVVAWKKKRASLSLRVLCIFENSYHDHLTSWSLEQAILLSILNLTALDLTTCIRGLWFSRSGWPLAPYIACENSPFSLLFTAGDFSPRGTSTSQWQKFHTDDLNQCSHD